MGLHSAETASAARKARPWLGIALLVATTSAKAQPVPAAAAPTTTASSATAPAPPATAEAPRVAPEFETAPPPPSSVYLQYGVAFATEQILSAGSICENESVPCILGAGGGIVVRGGWRSKGPLYLGLAYELTKQDPNKLYRIALLQQGRAESRYYFMTARVMEPYATAALGVAGYGNEWAIDTWGPTGSLGAGVEYQITQRTVVGLAFAFRLLYLKSFTDTAGTWRDGGIAQLLGLDLVLEQRDAIVTTGAEEPRSP